MNTDKHVADIERMARDLPPLPDPDMGHQKAPDDCELETSYSADAMRAYGALVRAQALEDAARVVEPSPGIEPQDIREDAYEMLLELAAAIRALASDPKEMT